MASYEDLDIDSIVRIGLMYLDGDQFENVLLDRVGHTDYDFDHFINVKNSLSKMEKINPRLKLCAVLWQRHPANDKVVIPLVAGTSLPLEGWARTASNEQMDKVFATHEKQVLKRNKHVNSHYYPVRNSNYEVVGLLEILEGMGEIMDI